MDYELMRLGDILDYHRAKYNNSHKFFKAEYWELYQKAKVKRGDLPVLDDIGTNRAYLFYSKQKNPNQPIFQPNKA